MYSPLYVLFVREQITQKVWCGVEENIQGTEIYEGTVGF